MTHAHQVKGDVRCTLEIGCDETGVCYADAMGQPEQCGRIESCDHSQGGKMMEQRIEVYKATAKSHPPERLFNVQLQFWELMAKDGRTVNTLSSQILFYAPSEAAGRAKAHEWLEEEKERQSRIEAKNEGTRARFEKQRAEKEKAAAKLKGRKK